MEHPPNISPPPLPLYVPDYSQYYRGCNTCGRILAYVRDSLPMPCRACFATHYCTVPCFVAHMRSGHRQQCFATLDAEVDMCSAEAPTSAQVLWDLRRFTFRWHDQLADAAIAAMNLHTDPSAMTRYALVVHLAYVMQEPRRTKRFRLQFVKVDPLDSLAGTTMHEALIRREDSHAINQKNGMVGCVLIMLACLVPGIGFIFNSTFIGPEPSILADPPPDDWLNRLWLILRHT